MKTSMFSRLHVKQHAFVGNRCLLSAVFSLACIEESESMEGACLWLSTLPSTGRTPHRMADLESITGQTLEQRTAIFLLEDIPRITADAAFWLPPFVEPEFPDTVAEDKGFDPWDMKISTTQATSYTDHDSGLALFRLERYKHQPGAGGGRTSSMLRHLQS